MHKSILVLEESKMVHDLFESALPREYWDWHIEHESTPENYVARAAETLPGIIFLSNRDQKNNYAIAREIRSSSKTRQIPILLLTVARDKLNEKQLKSIGIQGFLRKPFESATLLEQIQATLQNHSHRFQKDRSNVLENVDVVDNELMSLLSAKAAPGISMGNLEEELDPTLQLHPVEAEAMLLDDAEISEYDDPLIEEETEDDASEDAEGIFVSDELEDTDGFYDLEQEDAETAAIELELEEISLDIEEYDQDMIETPAKEPIAAAETGTRGFMKLEVSINPQRQTTESVENLSGPDDIGIMEIEVIPLTAGGGSVDAVSTTDGLEDREDTDRFTAETEQSLQVIQVIRSGSGGKRAVKPHTTVTNLLTADDTGIPYTSLEVELVEAEDLIEIEHSEINDELDDNFESDYLSEFDDSELLEISVEGMADDTGDESEDGADLVDETEPPEDGFDALVMPETTDSEDEDLVDVNPEDIIVSNLPDDMAPEGNSLEEMQEIEVLDETSSLEADDFEQPVVEQDGVENLEIDFESAGDTASEEVENVLEGLDDIDPSSAQMNIQEMINFRQIMKAKYDIPETNIEEPDDTATDDESLEIDFLSDDEIDDFNTLDGAGDSDELNLDKGMPEDDRDLLIDEFEDEEIDIFADVGDDDISDVDLFADDGDSEMLEEPSDDVLSEAEDDLLMDDLQENDEAPDLPDGEFFGDDVDSAVDDGLLGDDNLLVDDAGLEEMEEDLLVDDAGLEEMEDGIFDSETIDGSGSFPDAEEDAEDRIFDSISESATEKSDPIDLLSDDLKLDESPLAIKTGDSDAVPDSGESDTELEKNESAIDTFQESEAEMDSLLEHDLDVSDAEILVDPDMTGDPLLKEVDGVDAADILSDPELSDDLLLEDKVDEVDDGNLMVDLEDDDLFSDSTIEMNYKGSDASDDLLMTDESEETDIEAIAADENDMLMEVPGETCPDENPLLIDDPGESEEVFEEIALPAEDEKLFSDVPKGAQADPDAGLENMEAISEADAVAIEVPQDVFEISDLKMSYLDDDEEAESEFLYNDATSDDGHLESEAAHETEPEFTENIDLPSMDEDLPDLPSVFDDESDEEGLLFEAGDELAADPAESSMERADELLGSSSGIQTAADDGIEILQSDTDFDSFPDETETIAFLEQPDPQRPEATAGSREPVAAEAQPRAPEARQKKGRAFSPELREKLSSMIENIISETVQTALHDMLPEMMEQIIQEELEE